MLTRTVDNFLALLQPISQHGTIEQSAAATDRTERIAPRFGNLTVAAPDRDSYYQTGRYLPWLAHHRHALPFQLDHPNLIAVLEGHRIRWVDVETILTKAHF